MAEPVTIPISYLEITVDYERPDFRLWLDRAVVVQDIFDALKPWNITVDDVELHTKGKPSEQGITFKLPLKRIAFFFGVAACKFTRDDADWSAADETIAILDVALSALTRRSGAVLGKKNTTIAIHVQPRKLPFMNILLPLLVLDLAGLEKEPLTTMAVVAKWPNRKVTIDGSAALANGVFLKLERGFETTITYEEMGQRLREDEAALFKILGLEEDQG